MPVVTVVAAPLRSRKAELDGIVAVNRAVADALGLMATDVFCVHVPAGVAAVGGEAVTPWPVVTIHGRDRGVEACARSLAAAGSAVASAWQCNQDAVWVQWAHRT